jgi:amino acid adenylation domain-containing protein
VVALFNAQVEKTPHAAAVAFAGQELTYQELSDRATELAVELQKLGVGADTLVGLCLPRSVELTVALLAILKAGGAYLPLDISYPRDHLAFLMSDAQISILVTDSNLLSQLPATTARVLLVDHGQHESSDWEQSSLNSHPCDLAYVIYTSGSTGKPKGVAMPHLPLLNLIEWQRHNAIAGEGDKTLQFSPIGFDVSFQEIFATWAAGGTLVLVSEQVRRDPETLLKYLRDNQVARLFLPFVALQQLAEVADQTEELPPLKEVITAGEQLQISPAIARFFHRLPNCTLCNQYGPSETHVATAFTLTGPPDTWPPLPPIGRPIANAKVYVLDQALQPVPIGIPGELYLGGVSPAREYLNRKELTQEKFIVNPFSGNSRDRLYKTGDLVRYLPDGNLEYLGRSDTQVKVRGFRIELGEIEVALNQYPQVKQGAVAVRQGGTGEKYLAAYVVWQETGNREALRQFLAQQLPEYMVPSAIEVLEALPLTPSGKIDRRSLPDSQEPNPPFLPPRTPIEEVVAGVFAEVLGRVDVGSNSDFFQLGGHSLLATRVVSRLREALAVELSLRTLFESPTVAQLASVIASGSELRSIKQLRREADGSILPAIEPVSRETPLPLSWGQERLWFLQQLEGASATYNMPSALQLQGKLEVEILERALSEIVRRHEILRTCFPAIDGQPTPAIAAPTPISIPIIDLQSLPDRDRALEVERQTIAVTRQPFNLETDRLFRVTLLRLEPTSHVLLAATHHIISDGWSSDILVRELSALYQAFLDGTPSPLPELSIQYADFAVWQRQWLSGAVLDQQLTSWRERLSGLPARLELPTDRPRPAVQTFSGGSERLVLDRQLLAKLQQTARKSGATLYMILLGAWSALLSRWSGQKDLAIGSPFANRERVEIEPLIGFFVNTLVLRVNLEGNPTFSALLERVRKVALEAYSDRDVPFEKLVEALQVQRSLSHTPLFQVWFNLINLEEKDLQLGELTIEPLSLPDSPSKFDLTLYAKEIDSGLELRTVYNADLFDSERIAEMLAQFHSLVTQAVNTPNHRLDQLSLLTSSSAEKLPNPTRVLSSSWQGSILDRLSRHAQEKPDTLAITDHCLSLSYRELEHRSSQLANLLISQGISPQDVVAIYADRSALTVLAILAIWKAGAAFTILDPAYPVSRLLQQLEAVCPRGWLQVATEKSMPSDLTHYLENHGLPCHVNLQEKWETEESAIAAPKVDIKPDHLAYIAFTSGSTGVPKGILGTHRPLSHFISWQIAEFKLQDCDRFAMLSGLAHDPLLRDILTPLWLGATLCIPRQTDLETPGKLPRWMKENQISTVHLTPAMGGVLTAEMGQCLDRLQKVFFGGDRLSGEDVDRMQNLAPNATCINFYGTTETPQAHGYFVVPPGEKIAGDIPIGCGIAASQLLVVNEGRGMAGIGEVGEIYVRSPHLAPGYLADEKLTRERFILNPFSDSRTRNDRDRLYRTGDRGRYRLDGTVEFVGRTDTLVNLRGFRIELTEIETAIEAYPGVERAAVWLQGEKTVEKRLLAGVVWQESAFQELREFLKTRLPEYAIPNGFVSLETLPLTPNGKVDRAKLAARGNRAALAQLAPAAPVEKPDFAPPRTATEEILVNTFATVLELPAIGIYDDFFASGGHSLLAMRVVSRLRSSLGVELSVRALFESPTVAQLASAIAQLRREADGSILPPIEPVPRDGSEFPLSRSQERLWFLHQLEGESAAYNMPSALQITGKLDMAALKRAFDTLVSRHEILRTTFPKVNNHPVQKIAPHWQVPIPIIDLQDYSQQQQSLEVQRLAIAESSQPFNLETDPPMRVTLLQQTQESSVLLVTLHHIVSDGWSNGILIREISTLYESYTSGTPANLPELPIQYLDFALWQRQYLNQEEQIGKSLAYWREQLADLPALLELPTDRPRPPVQTFNGAAETFTLDRALTDKLQQLSRKNGATLFMTLLSAFGILLSRYSGQEDVVVGSPIANRNSSALEPLMGCFVNTLALRLNLADTPTFSEFLSRVRQTTLDAYSHQDLPFETLVEAVQPERTLSYTPLFQVMFVLQNAPVEELALSGVTLTPLEGERTTAKFDITLSMEETESGLSGTWEYNRDLFDASTVQRSIEHFQILLEAIVTDSDRSVGELPLLSESEKQQLLVQWNQTDLATNTDRCIHHLFEESVRQTPNAVAVTGEETNLTYEQLNRQADHLAASLQSLGVGSEVPVGVFLDRDPTLIVALMGIFKAGGAYVPLDPDYPLERIRIILEDSGVSVLLTESKLRDRLPEVTCETVELDGEWAFRDRPQDVQVTEENLAYIIYTSGSTGRPKGVAIEHRNAVTLLKWAQKIFPPQDLTGVLASTSLCFDLSVFEIFLPLSCGGRVILARNALQLPHLSAATEVTLVNTVPSAIAELYRSGGIPPAVRTINLAGEPLKNKLVQQLYQLEHIERVFNLYGPSEDTTYSTFTQVEKGATQEPAIGRPIGNSQAYVLDQYLHPVPIGVKGELYLGGAGVARGYYQRRDLTGERFIQDPFADHPQARLYKTGDLARYRPDGDLEYLGRIDGQVKIRGFRIEVGEVEVALSRHPNVEEAVVAARPGVGDELQLVAYIVPVRDSPSTAELRTFLKQQLPAYSVPGVFVFLETLPLTPNGKIDRRHLPAPEAIEGSPAEEFLAPRTQTEEHLAQLWCEVLEKESIAIDRDFFELGGHSLLATRVISRIQEIFPETVSLRDLFENPTIASLATLIETRQLAQASEEDLEGILAEIEGLT